MRTSLKQHLLIAAIAVTFGALLLWAFARTNEAHAQFTCSGGTHTAQAFDTIWQIASANCEGNLENAVYHMVQLNDGRAMIQIGQAVEIPTGPTR
tara:strand:- start:170 stop:454 length:285 start_codon:yes stop_codon:yes gene_type:complete